MSTKHGIKPFHIRLHNLIFPVVLSLLVSCGGGPNNGGGPASNSVSLTVGPAAETVLYTFGVTASGSAGLAQDASQPQAPPIQASDGNFYGTTSSGGINSCGGVPYSCGTVYKITPTGIETVLYSFGASPSDGMRPTGSLIQASDGNFYGTTARGGAYGNGTVFRMTPAGIETVLYSFGGSPSDGAVPAGSLIIASDGNFYGTTAEGGANSCYGAANFCGTVFRITPSGVETVLYSFEATPSDGYNPEGSLIQASDGNLYGTTSDGGAHYISTVNGVVGGGTVFELTLSGVETVLYSFGSSVSKGIALDGSTPQGALIQGRDGNFYGTTAAGGTSASYVNPNVTDGFGTLFKLTPTGVETVVYSFGAATSDGYNPYGPIIQANDGNFYGTTRWGGSNNWEGTAFQITPGGTETILHSFGSASDGADAVGLIQASDGTFYGATAAVMSQASGSASNGTLLSTGTIFTLVP